LKEVLFQEADLNEESERKQTQTPKVQQAVDQTETVSWVSFYNP